MEGEIEIVFLKFEALFLNEQVPVRLTLMVLPDTAFETDLDCYRGLDILFRY